MLNPLLQFAVFYLVFRFILPVGRENYGLFLFIGLACLGLVSELTANRLFRNR